MRKESIDLSTKSLPARQLAVPVEPSPTLTSVDTTRLIRLITIVLAVLLHVRHSACGVILCHSLGAETGCLPLESTGKLISAQLR